MTPDRFFVIQLLFFLVWVCALLYTPALRPLEVAVRATASPSAHPPIGGPLPPGGGPRPPVAPASRPPLVRPPGAGGPAVGGPPATPVPPSASASPPMAIPVTPGSASPAPLASPVGP